MARFLWFSMLQVLLFNFSSLITARPNLYPKGGLPHAGPGADAPASLFVRDEEWMPHGSCAPGLKISPREFQQIFARAGSGASSGHPSERTMNPAFVDLLHQHGFYTDRLEFLGGGACGRVFRVNWGGVDYAAKVTSADPSSRGANGLLLRENDVMEVTGDYPHIVQKYWLLEGKTPTNLKNIYGPTLYIMVTEFCKHGALNILDSFQSPREEVIRQIKGIWEALVHLRSLGYYHKDIKPDNIMVQEGGDWKLGDFGSASQLREGLFHGTIPYAPPEVLAVWSNPADRVRTNFDIEKCDVFAFAVTMVEVLYGKKLFADDGSNTEACLRTSCWKNTSMSLAESIMFSQMLHPIPSRQPDFDKATRFILDMK